MYLITGWQTPQQAVLGPVSVTSGTNTIKASQFFGKPLSGMSPSAPAPAPTSSSSPTPTPTPTPPPSSPATPSWGTSAYVWMAFSFFIVFVGSYYVAKLPMSHSIGIAIAAVIVAAGIEYFLQK
jgi:hypothetical protein